MRRRKWWGRVRDRRNCDEVWHRRRIDELRRERDVEWRGRGRRRSESQRQRRGERFRTIRGHRSAGASGLENPAYPPPALVVYPTAPDDQTFKTFSADWKTSIESAGGFQIDCASAIEFTDANFYTSLSSVAWQFLKDHPYGVKPEPYKSLPSGWPSYCSIE